jgi:hypothetical protein
VLDELLKVVEESVSVRPASGKVRRLSEVSTIMRRDALPGNFNSTSFLQSFPRFHSAHHNNKPYNFKEFKKSKSTDCGCENLLAGN